MHYFVLCLLHRQASWKGYYDCFVQELLHSNFNVLRDLQVNRDVEESSLTHESKRRDLNVWLNNLLVVCGEDKKSTDEAERELQSKNKGSNAVFYGRLDYILSFATGGPHIRFFALPLAHSASPIPISMVYDMSNTSHRLLVMLSFINIWRWCISIKDELAKPPALLHTVWTSPSPFVIDECTELQLHHNFITKTFNIPRKFLSNLCEVYKLCNDGSLRHCIQLKYLKLNNTAIKSYRASEFTNNRYKVEVALHPIGQRKLPTTEIELKNAILCVLLFLEDLHSNKYVHRDLRWPNILRLSDSWMVIDLETAGPNNTHIFWAAKSGTMPEHVRNMGSPYVFKTDLYQVGRLIEDAPVRISEEAKLFSDALKRGDYDTVRDALQNPWLKQL